MKSITRKIRTDNKRQENKGFQFQILIHLKKSLIALIEILVENDQIEIFWLNLL